MADEKPPKPVKPASAAKSYRLKLKAGIGQASFMAGGVAVELSDEEPLFETEDRLVYFGARDLPFLEDAS